MIKQKIKVAVVAIIGFITFWLVMFNFIKIDVSSNVLVTLADTIPQVSIESKTGSYIENHSIDSIKLNYQNQYYWCSISLINSGNDYYQYSIILPDVVDKTQQFFTTYIIADKLNVYQYLFAK